MGTVQNEVVLTFTLGARNRREKSLYECSLNSHQSRNVLLATVAASPTASLDGAQLAAFYEQAGTAIAIHFSASNVRDNAPYRNPFQASEGSPSSQIGNAFAEKALGEIFKLPEFQTLNLKAIVLHDGFEKPADIGMVGFRIRVSSLFSKALHIVFWGVLTLLSYFLQTELPNGAFHYTYTRLIEQYFMREWGQKFNFEEYPGLIRMVEDDAVRVDSDDDDLTQFTHEWDP